MGIVLRHLKSLVVFGQGILLINPSAYKVRSQKK